MHLNSVSALESDNGSLIKCDSGLWSVIRIHRHISNAEYSRSDIEDAGRQNRAAACLVDDTARNISRSDSVVRIGGGGGCGRGLDAGDVELEGRGGIKDAG